MYCNTYHNVKVYKRLQSYEFSSDYRQRKPKNLVLPQNKERRAVTVTSLFLIHDDFRKFHMIGYIHKAIACQIAKLAANNLAVGPRNL